MTVLLWACLNGQCTTVFFRTTYGKCPACGEEGYRVAWALRPPRRRDPPDDPPN